MVRPLPCHVHATRCVKGPPAQKLLRLITILAWAPIFWTDALAWGRGGTPHRPWLTGGRPDFIRISAGWCLGYLREWNPFLTPVQPSHEGTAPAIFTKAAGVPNCTLCLGSCEPERSRILSSVMLPRPRAVAIYVDGMRPMKDAGKSRCRPASYKSLSPFCILSPYASIATSICYTPEKHQSRSWLRWTALLCPGEG